VCSSDLSKYRRSNSSDRTATAKANVVTARNRPRIRRAGNPTTTAKPAVKTVATGTASQKVRPAFDVRAPAMTAPTATKANWPRLTWPAQPVSTTRDSATMAYRAMTPPRLVCPVDVTNGKIPTARSPTTTMTRRVMRTDGTPSSSLGMGRCSSLACQALATSSPPRKALRCCSSRPAAMRPRRPRSTSALSLSSENRVASETAEMATAAKTVAGRLRMRPTTAAASAGSSTPGAKPAAAPGWVRAPVSVTLAPASNPARPHTSVDSRLTLMPRRAARSVFSAMARTATPDRVKRKKAARPRSSRIATSMAKISGNPKRTA
jgi:hypothetical protein